MAFKYSETGRDVWLAGLAISRYITEHPKCVQGKVVLDLGAGRGLACQAALAAQAQHVVFIDLPDNIQSQQTNTLMESYKNLSVMQWDWNINFGVEQVPLEIRERIGQTPVIVLASDLFYEEEEIDDVLASIWTFLQLGSSVEENVCFATLPHRTLDWSISPFLVRWGFEARKVDVKDIVAKIEEEIDSGVFEEPFGDDFTSMTCLELRIKSSHAFSQYEPIIGISDCVSHF